MDEIEANVGVVTETWLQNDAVEGLTIDAAGEHGLEILALNRETVADNGRQYGGVAIITKRASSKFKALTVPNPEAFKVPCAGGKNNGIKEKVVIVAAYIQPNYNRTRALACLDYVSDVIAEAKRVYVSPLIVVAGDWNQWPLEVVRDDHPDLHEVDHGPTRGDRKIDRFLVNFSRSIRLSDTLCPLDDGQGRESNHRVAFSRAALTAPKDKIISYRYRHYTETGARSFQEWIGGESFGEVFSAGNVNDQLAALMTTLEVGMNRFFPYKTTTRREKDPPWINWKVKWLVKKRRAIYHREGRSHVWKALMKKSRKLVRDRAAKYWEGQKRNLLKPDADRSFYKNVKAYDSKEKPAPFNVRKIFPEAKDDAEVAEKLADHFNGISSEFAGLDPIDIPTTFGSSIPSLTEQSVCERLRAFKKPKSMVKHDIFPSLINEAAPALSRPLAKIFNKISEKQVWPLLWKEEFVTPIPKKPVPETVDDLRNISCTALFSKVYKSYVLGWLGEQVGMRSNQLGGMRGAGTEHYQVQLWQEVLESLEDPRSGSIITSIDYAKAFNRLDFLHCLRALAAKGASSELLRVVASFLTSRTMVVKVGGVMSKPRIVLGGVPQGSILGVFLFNVTIDGFEAGSRDIRSCPTIGGADRPQTEAQQGHRDRSYELYAERPYNRPGFKQWEPRPLIVLKYVDDNVLVEKLCFDGLVIDMDGKKVAQAIRSQNLFRLITREADSWGMKVNSSKTLMLCISDSRTYLAEAYIEDEEGRRVCSSDHMKILGLHFSNKPDMNAQVNDICRKFRSRIWVLRHLHHVQGKKSCFYVIKKIKISDGKGKKSDFSTNIW